MSTETLEMPPETAGHEDRPVVAGVLAEYHDVDGIMAAAKAVRDAGYKRWDCHTPFPVHGLDGAMGVKPTILPFIVLLGGLTGLTAGFLLTWYTNAFDYQFLISGKPIWSFPANIPVIFETTVAGSAFTCVFAMLIMNKLPMHYNPLLKVDRFRRVTDDRFFVVIDARDAKFDLEKVESLLESTHPKAIERFED